MRVALLAGLLVLGSPVAAQTVKAGIDAWSAGRFAEAAAIWRPLAASGSPDAAFNLAQAYKLGRGVPTDLAMAQRLYEQAAKAGHGEAQASLGLMLFQNGNRTEALRWLKEAAESGEPRAMLIYGTAVFNGEGVARDPVRAYAFVSRAAAQGLVPAKDTLADMDGVIPLEQRKAGVALAQQWAGSAPARTTPPAVQAPKKEAAAKVAPVPLPSVASTPGAIAGGFRIQLGAFKDRAAAQALYAKVKPRVGGAGMILSPAGAVTRLQVGPYPSRAAAAAACASLKPLPCFPVAAS